MSLCYVKTRIDHLNYLSCIDIKKDWFNAKYFYDWIVNQLMFYCNVFFVSRNVIIMNNVTIHINARITKIIEQHDCQVRYLLSYFFDFNSIELSFFVLKTWVKRHFHETWSNFESDFETFLSYAITRSRCDRFAMKHFKHIAYERLRFQDDIHAFNARLTINEVNLKWK